MFILDCNPHRAKKDAKIESRVKMEKSSNHFIADKEILSSQISATFIFPDPGSSFVPLQTNINPSDKNVLVFNELKTPITKNTKQVNDSKPTTTLSTAIQETKIKTNNQKQIVKTKDFDSSAGLDEEEFTCNNLDSDGLSEQKSNERQPLHLHTESGNKEEEERNSKKDCRDQKSSSNIQTSHDCEISSGSIYNVRISATTGGSQKRKSKSKSQTKLSIPHSIVIEKSKHLKAMSKTSFHLCPSCSKTPLIYQERRLNNENNSILKVPPFCGSCKAYIVSESSHEQDVLEQLANLTEWMTDSELDVDSDSDLKQRPMKGTILVMLDNKSTAGHNKESNPPISREEEKDQKIKNQSQSEARDPYIDDKETVKEETNITENQSQLKEGSPDNVDRETVEEEESVIENQSLLETRNPDNDLRENDEVDDTNHLVNKRVDCEDRFTSQQDRPMKNSYFPNNGDSLSNNDQEVNHNIVISVNKNENPISDEKYSSLKLNTMQQTSNDQRDSESQLRLINTDDEEEIIMGDYNQK